MSVAISARAYEAPRRVGTSLTADSKEVALVDVFAGAVVLPKSETRSAEASRTRLLVHTALCEIMSLLIHH